MKSMAILIAVAAFVSGAYALDNASNSTAATMAVADPSRPDSDTTRDADRKPAETLVFVGIKSGDKVADYVADAGYFTRLFANVVGPTGHVYAVEPTAFFKFEHFVKSVAELPRNTITHSNATIMSAAPAVTGTAQWMTTHPTSSAPDLMECADLKKVVGTTAHTCTAYEM